MNFSEACVTLARLERKVYDVITGVSREMLSD